MTARRAGYPPRMPSPIRRVLRTALGCLLLATPARAADDWLRVEAPDEGASVSLPLVEVRGRAAPGGAAAKHVARAIDVTDSVLMP